MSNCAYGDQIEEEHFDCEVVYDRERDHMVYMWLLRNECDDAYYYWAEEEEDCNSVSHRNQMVYMWLLANNLIVGLLKSEYLTESDMTEDEDEDEYEDEYEDEDEISYEDTTDESSFTDDDVSCYWHAEAWYCEVAGCLEYRPPPASALPYPIWAQTSQP